MFLYVFQTGFFMEPTVFTDVEDHMYLAKEESFGPIMVISKFQNGYVPKTQMNRFWLDKFFFLLPLCNMQNLRSMNMHVSSIRITGLIKINGREGQPM